MAIFSEEIFLEAGATEGEAIGVLETLAREQGIIISILVVDYVGETGEEDSFEITYEADQEIDY